MGKLDALKQSLSTLEEKRRKAQLSSAFGVDLDNAVEEEDPTQEALEELADCVKGVGTAITATGEAQEANVTAISASLDKQIKAIQATSKDQQEQLQKAVRAQVETLKQAMDAIATRNDERLASLIETLQNQRNPELVAALSAMGATREPQAYQFDIERNRQGFMTSVIATPI